MAAFAIGVTRKAASAAFLSAVRGHQSIGLGGRETPGHPRRRATLWHRPLRLGFPERRAGFGEVTEVIRRAPAIAELLVPARDLLVDLAYADRVGPVHRRAATAREPTASPPHHAVIPAPQRAPNCEDPASLVDPSEPKPL